MERIISFIRNLFPNLKLYRPDKDRIHWIMQAIIGGMAFAITWWLLSKALLYLGDILSSVIRKST